MSTADAELARVRQVVSQLNEAWQAEQFDDMAPLFHERAVIVDGEHRRLAEGRAPCVDSYRAFMAAATVEEYTEDPPHIHLAGATAVVTYPFTMQYMMNDKGHRESGTDCLVLTRHSAGEWQVLWRQVVWHAV